MEHVLKWDRRSPAWARIFIVFLPIALLLTALSPVAHADGAVLKVGYSDSDGITVDEEGNHSGYAVDYLEEIAKYTGWEYEYVCNSWTNGLAMLERGELDLLVMVNYTEERGERLLFSQLSMAHDYTALYAAADSDIYYQDYPAFDGLRVGVVAETVFEVSFACYAREQKLDCELVRFSTEAEAKDALLRGDIGLLATSGFSDHPEIKLVDRFQLERCYLATGMQNQALMDEVNAAVQKARMKNQNLENDLMQTYIGANISVTGLYLTREEQAYLDSVGPIVVKGFGGRRPMGYTTADGRFVGILADYLDMLGAVSGLEFVYEPAELLSLEENAAAMDEEGFVLLSVDQPLEDMAMKTPLYKSDTLFQTALAYVRRQGEYVTKTDPHTFAVNSALSYVGDMLLETNAQSTVLFYDTSQECMEAVLDGEAEMTILDEHVAAYLLQKPKFANNLMQVAGSEAYVDGMCLYAPEEHRPLVSILNKTMERLSTEQRINAEADAALAHAYTYQLEDILYEHENTIRVALGLLAVITVLGVMLYARAATLKKREMENKALQEQIQHDELTGVYNRTGFFDKAGDMIARSGGGGICIVRLNICHFKVVNELHGMEKGDRLLREIGQGLMALSRQRSFIVGRFTADHFYLCIRREDFESINFARRSSAPWLGMDISTTYGVYPVEEQTNLPVSAMCDRADMAIASNEQAAEYICYYSDASRQRLLREQEIENEMEQAVAERQFCIYIQPKHDIETEAIVGGEVLVRWKHPRKGMIPPGDFIGLFERNGFILKLDYYIWEESCRFLAEARQKGLPAYPLSVNVSRIHLYGTELQGKLMELLDRYGLEAGDLELEITESVCAEEPDLIFKTCADLRKAGFKIAMDDFGSGYSSLNMLKEMPLDIIKMDLRFLSGETDAEQVEKGRNILRTLIELAHTLGLQVVVEGLETQSQKDFIRSIGSCAAQGYYYSRPVDCRSYEAMIG